MMSLISWSDVSDIIPRKDIMEKKLQLNALKILREYIKDLLVKTYWRGCISAAYGGYLKDIAANNFNAGDI